MAEWSIVNPLDRDQLGEGPLWSARDGALYWVDILRQKLNRLRLGDGRMSSWSLPEMIGWVIERRHQPGFIAGLRSGFAELQLDPFEVCVIARPEPDRPGNRLNDAKADSAGRIYAGSMPVAADQPTGGFYRFDADRTITRLDDGYVIANGPAFSCDERYLFHTDSAQRTVFRYAVRGDGSLGERRSFIEFPQDWGQPDGMTVDANDHLWVAHWDGARVSRFAPDGSLQNSIALPTPQITSCTFAGPGLDRMFVTTAAVGRDGDVFAGKVFEVDPRTRGLAPNVFAG
jgi:sugar lactone lactonase YvrE